MTADKSSMSIAIVGGGLGGVSAAIALGRAGYQVHIFEQGAEFSELGLGIGMGPNTLRAFELLGVLNTFRDVAELLPAGSSWARYLAHEDSAEVADVRFAGQAAFMHRKRVLEALVARLPPNVRTHFSARIVAVTDVAAGARVRLEVAPAKDKRSHPPVDALEFDAVIGADGIRSSIREKIFPGAHARWTGMYGYRNLLPMHEAEEILGPMAHQACVWMGPGRHVAGFPVERGAFFNFVASVGERDKPLAERVWDGPWVRPGDREEMLGQFAGWDKRVLELLKRIEKPEKWAMCDLEPLERWTAGRVTLLGDAAHASVPYNGAGAGQAIEDAYVLGALLALPECNAETLPVFLQAYEDVRKPRASEQQRHSLRTGDMLQFAGEPGADYSRIGEDLHKRFLWIWEHELEADVEAAKEKLRTAGVIGRNQ